jgi:molybdopterin converting factor small subunit
MMITAHFHGILADWVGAPSAVFDLAAGATLADLMHEIGRRYRRNMPEQLWDRQTGSFQKQVRAQGAATIYTDLNTPLKGEAEITFMLMIAGG